MKENEKVKKNEVDSCDSKKNIDLKHDAINEKKTAKAPLTDRIEDAMDDVVGGIQDLIYGPKTDFTHDIPATMDHPSGIRRINKVQTRRNVFKRFGGKTYVKILLIILVIALLIAGIRYLVMMLLLS